MRTRRDVDPGRWLVSGPVRLGVAGAGLIGRRHVAAIAAAPGAELVGIADPDPAAAAVAAAHGVPHWPSLAALLEGAAPDGAIIATPNTRHAEDAMMAVTAGVAALVEKPLVDDLAAGMALVEAAERAGVPLQCGHHRRHNALVAAAKASLDNGDVGRLVAFHAHAWLMKPDDYFNAWRRSAGGGPVLINLIHDIDLARHFAGDIVEVMAMTGFSRGHAVEDTAVVALRFASGVLGTMTVSDTVAAPCSYELTAGENPAYPQTGAVALLVGGTAGTLEVPAAALWHYEGERSWTAPISRRHLVMGPRVDPLVAQIGNFAEAIQGRAAPLVTGRDGLKALAVVDAIHRAALSCRAETPAL